ncbi:cell division protein ZapE [Rhodopila globiformis]|uniref:Cell division protein ZapE n=1 Tax=Rhodopila globiformis TaxID=1071 RepID=A0A2S6N037_RHOGL|nr:cell division protein ZapE [Rhodopila globiformis]PPQ27981.1 cell division protein ZapE [Rhodopila globiformis]
MTHLTISPYGRQSGPLPVYHEKIKAGVLEPDPAQAMAVERLQDLWERLRGYDPRPFTGESVSFLTRIMRRRHAEEYVPTGLYLVGEVGRGKSMLMDMFFATADVPRKQRIHFHRFMQDVHARVHAWKKANPQGADPIQPLADRISAESALLCFDEFQVNDIADAMILGRLFQCLFDRGVVVVTTSNIVPDDLFKGQPGRDAFLPFIALIKQRLDVLVMDGGRDYRRERLRGLRTWLVPADAMSRRRLDEAFEQLTGSADAQPVTLTVMGRDLVVQQAADGVARFEFDFLCNTALGAGDYLAIATAFHTVILDGIPRLSPDNYDAARRFIVLVDTLYDHRVKLVASADDTPDRLYQRGKNAKMFERTASRLDEMQSEDWLALAHQE